MKRKTLLRAVRAASARTLARQALSGAIALSAVTGGFAVLNLATAATARAADVSNEYTQRFLTQYNKIKDPANGYFSPEGVPYHSVETLLVEAPDYGHETTSEAYSFWLWLEAQYGRATGDWAPLNAAWANMEKYIIPATKDQPTNSFYSATKPATYAAEFALPSGYPAPLQTSVPVGQDPIAAELAAAYGTKDVYGSTGCWTWTTGMATAGAVTARPGPPTSTPSSVARRNRCGRRFPILPATCSSGAAPAARKAS